MSLKRFGDSLAAFVISIPNSYSIILFSDSTLLGLMLLAVSFFSPMLGLTGLLGLLTAMALGRIAGFEPWESRSGILGFNSLILSLAVGYYYPTVLIYQNPWFFIAFVMTASIFTMFLYLVLSHFTLTWLRMPAMSLAFSIAATMVWYYMAKNGFLANYTHDKPLLFEVNIILPEFWRLFFVSLGSIFFIPSVLGGILIALALIVSSRISFFTALWGWLLCYLMIRFSGLGTGNGMFYPGFNIVLIVISVGSIFLLPSKSAWLLAGLSGIFGFLVTILMHKVFHYYNPYTLYYTPLTVPVFAFPLNLITMLVVFTMRLRQKTTKPQINELGIYNPEKALEVYHSKYQRFAEAGIPQFALPFGGEWMITQGHHGEHTHKQSWAYAWDFEIEDVHGKKYSDSGTRVDEYYCFGKPVLASASGYVVRVVDTILDNPIGGMNTKNNWGNYVSISHGYGLYSLYAHLKQGSLTVKEGDYVAKGSRIGTVGNSGRSLIPHLHFQVQLGIEAGSKTVLSHLINYKLRTEDGGFAFIGSGIPNQNERISPLLADNKLLHILALDSDVKPEFMVLKGSESYTETWQQHLDFYGNNTLESSAGTSMEYSVYNGVLNVLGLKGKRLTALGAISLLVSRLPYAERQRLRCVDEPALSVSFFPPLKQLYLLMLPLFKTIKSVIQSDIVDSGNHLTITSEIYYHFLGIKLRGYKGEILITKNLGISSIKLMQKNKLLLSAQRITV